MNPDPVPAEAILAPLPTPNRDKLREDMALSLAKEMFDTYGDTDGVFWSGLSSADKDHARSAADAALALLPDRGGGAADDTNKLLRDAWGALNFILAFYEPGQTYLDTNAWKQAEAGGRRAHKAIREYLDAAAPTSQEGV